jgi:hypothetical protein
MPTANPYIQRLDLEKQQGSRGDEHAARGARAVPFARAREQAIWDLQLPRVLPPTHPVRDAAAGPNRRGPSLCKRPGAAPAEPLRARCRAWRWAAGVGAVDRI